MAISQQEAIEELERRGVDSNSLGDTTQPSFSQQQAIEELKSRGLSPTGEKIPEPSLLQKLSGYGKEAGREAYDVLGGGLEGAIQGAANVGNLPLQALGQRPFFQGVHVPGVREQTGGAQLGAGLGKGVPAGIIAALGFPEAAPEIMGAGAIGGAAAGGQTVPQRIGAGAAMGAFPMLPSAGKVAAKGLGKVGKALLPKHYSMKKLADLITKTHGEQKTIARGLYKDAFEGTENMKPVIGSGTQNEISNLLKMPAGKAEIERSLKRFGENSNVEGYHRLRSDFGKYYDRLRSQKSLDAVQGDKKDYLEKARENIDSDLERTMNNASSDNYNKFQSAQAHWHKNVVPFKEYRSLRKLLGKDHVITQALFKDVAQPAVEADRLKELLKVDPQAIKLTKYLKSTGKRIAPYAIGGAIGLPILHHFV